MAIRLLERALSASAVVTMEGESLSIGPEARWFSVPGGERVDLARRGALRRILSALVERHGEDGVKTFEAAELLEIGWPGERVLPTAGATRVRVAIASLRRLGLERYLLTYDQGYLLDPAARLKREP